MPVSATYVSNLSVSASFSGPFVSDTDAGYIIDKLNETGAMSGATTPAVSMAADFQAPLTAGAATIDFTALPSSSGVKDATGLKTRLVMLRNPATNANPITITEGLTNGLALLGTAFSITLQPGDRYGPLKLTNSPTVATADKTIDLVGTGAQALDCLFVLGPP